MKKRAILLALAALLGPGTAMAAEQGPVATVRAFLAAFNSGKVAAARATHEQVDDTIIDEMAPHVWRGAGAFDGWLASLTAFDKAQGRADGKVTLGMPQVATTEGDRAYVVIRAVYTFTQKGKPMREPATMSYALHKGAGGWKIAAWSWNGTVPQPVKK